MEKRYTVYIAAVLAVALAITAGVALAGLLHTVYDAVLVYAFVAGVGAVIVEKIDPRISAPKDARATLLLLIGGAVTLSMVGTVESLATAALSQNAVQLVTEIVKFVIQGIVGPGFIVLGASMLRGGKWDVNVTAPEPIKKIEIEK